MCHVVYWQRANVSGERTATVTGFMVQKPRSSIFNVLSLTSALSGKCGNMFKYLQKHKYLFTSTTKSIFWWIVHLHQNTMQEKQRFIIGHCSVRMHIDFVANYRWCVNCIQNVLLWLELIRQTTLHMSASSLCYCYAVTGYWGQWSRHVRKEYVWKLCVLQIGV
jgi:hypothetical protein